VCQHPFLDQAPPPNTGVEIWDGRLVLRNYMDIVDGDIVVSNAIPLFKPVCKPM
jgi:hypothetical protein